MSDWVDRYLRMLELERAPPSLDALADLCREQVARVPFENVTAILRRARTPSGPVAPLDTDAMLDAWEARAGGGVCVDASPTFRRLLLELGYTARGILAQISFPGSHQASIVTLDGRDYLVDVANGAPFFEPFPLDDETIIRRAGLAWRFRRAGADVLIQDRAIDGTWKPFCTYQLEAASAADIEAAYQRHQTLGESWVVGNLTIVRTTEDEIARLRDDELVRYSASGITSERVSDAALAALAADVFGVPGLPITQALNALRAARV